MIYQYISFNDFNKYLRSFIYDKKFKKSNLIITNKLKNLPSSVKTILFLKSHFHQEIVSPNINNQKA